MIRGMRIAASKFDVSVSLLEHNDHVYHVDDAMTKEDDGGTGSVKDDRLTQRMDDERM